MRAKGCESAHCVKVGFDTDVVEIWNSSDPNGPRLRFDYDEWNAFVEGIKNGDFD